MGQLAQLAVRVAAQPLVAGGGQVEEATGEHQLLGVRRLLGRLEEAARGMPVGAALQLARAQPEAGAGPVGTRRPLIVGRRVTVPGESYF